MDTERKIEENCKDIVELKIDKTALVAQVNAMSDTLHQEIKHIKELIEKSVVPKIEDVAEQAKKTNGRVTKLEDSTKVASVMFNNPWLYKLTSIGSTILALISLGGVITLIIKFMHLNV